MERRISFSVYFSYTEKWACLSKYMQLNTPRSRILV